MTMDGEGNLAIHLCAANGNLACLDALVEAKGSTQLLTKDKRGRTAWVIAALRGHAICAARIKELLSTDIAKVRLESVSNLDESDVTSFVLGLTTPDTVTPKTYREKVRSTLTHAWDEWRVLEDAHQRADALRLMRVAHARRPCSKTMLEDAHQRAAAPPIPPRRHPNPNFPFLRSLARSSHPWTRSTTGRGPT